MTVATEISRSGPHAGAGSPGPFTVGYRFLDQTHLEVIRTVDGVDTTLALGVDYTVAGVGNPTGSVTLTAPLAVGQQLTIIRNVPRTQEADYVQNDNFPSETHESALDKLTMITQELAEVIDRALIVPASVTGVSTDLPPPESNNLIGWNADADALQNVDPGTLGTIIAFGTSVVDIFSGTGAQTNFTLSENPGALANLHVSIGTADQRPGIDFTWVGGTTLTFTTAPPLGTQNILVQYMKALPQGTADLAASTLYGQSGSSLFDLNVERVVGSIAELRTLDHTKFRRAFVSGYYAPADGGGGSYHYDTTDVVSADNGGSVIVAADGGRWKLATGVELSVRQFGAHPNQPAAVNSTAFAAAIAATALIYVPPGTYQVNGVVDLPNLKRLRGAGERSSIIEAIHTDPGQPVIYLGGESRLDDIGIQFRADIPTGAETSGQRVGVQTHSPTTGFGTQRQGGMSNVRIANVGTGLYNAAGLGTACFSAVFDSIEIVNWSYRGVDFLGDGRTGNVFRNFYIHNAGTAFTNADIGFNFAGDESETTIEQLNVEAGTMNAAVSFFNTSALVCTGIHIEQVRLRANDSGLVKWDRSTGRIDSLTVYYSAIATTGWSVVKIFDATYGGAVANPNSHNGLHIGTLHCLGLNDSGTPPFDVGIGALVNFEFITRPLAAVGDFYMQVDRWVWNTFKGDSAVFTAFPHDSQNRIRFARTSSGPPVGANLIQNGWVRRPDGMIEQWGRINVNAGSTLTVNFHIPFPSAARAQYAQPLDTGLTNYRLNASPLSNTQFQITNTAAGVITTHWWAIGH